MIQAQTQTPEYWGRNFTITDADIEYLYNYFFDIGRPQTIQDLVRAIMQYRVSQEVQTVSRLLSGRTVYQPYKAYQAGEELIFPALQFAFGQVTAVRSGYNPQYGQFNVIQVVFNGKIREFAAELTADHALNHENTTQSLELDVDPDQIYQLYNYDVERKLTKRLELLEEFIRLGKQWFLKSLMMELNIGHMHLAEALLEMNDGGPLSPEQIIPDLDMDSSVNPEVQRFSLNYALLKDGRFDEIAPVGQVAWFLRRMEPDPVRETPERLRYTPLPYDRALLSPQLLALERELDDEWSELEPVGTPEATTLLITYPHVRAGTLPLSSRNRPLFPPSNSPRQRVIFIDESTGQEIPAWVVQEARYIYGFDKWFKENEIPVGGYIYLRPGPKPGVIILNYDRRRPQREWVRLAAVFDNQLKFELSRRSIGCGYDDLLIVGTDLITAVDALFRRIEAHQRSVASLLADLFPQLSNLTPQNTVHAKTLYSAVNMLRRVPPGPIFAELVRHPAFQAVGDHYWRFDSTRWRS